MTGFPILSVLIAVPMIAAIACLFVSANTARTLALSATLIDFVLGISLAINLRLRFSVLLCGGWSGSGSGARSPGAAAASTNVVASASMPAS